MRRAAALAVLALALTASADTFKKWVKNGGTKSKTALTALASPTDNCSGAAITGAGGNALTFSRASNAFCTKDDGTLLLVNSNVPRVDGNGYLSEAASTNICLQSQTLATSPWGVAGVSATTPVVTVDQTTAPDGTNTADQIAFGSTATAASLSALFQSMTLTATTYTASVWLKAASSVTVYLMLARNTTYFSTACSVTTAWSRCTVSGTGTAAAWSVELGGDRRSGSGQPAISAVTVFAWGMQVEAKPYATSNITTVAASVTRAADLLTCTTPSAFPASKGSVSVTVLPQWTTGPLATGVLFTALSANQGLRLLALTDTTLQLQMGNGASTTNTTSSALVWAAGTPYVVLTTWRGGARTVTRAGTSVATATGALMPTGTASPLGFGAATDGTAQCDCYLKNLVVTR